MNRKLEFELCFLLDLMIVYKFHIFYFHLQITIFVLLILPSLLLMFIVMWHFTLASNHVVWIELLVSFVSCSHPSLATKPSSTPPAGFPHTRVIIHRLTLFSSCSLYHSLSFCVSSVSFFSFFIPSHIGSSFLWAILWFWSIDNLKLLYFIFLCTFIFF